MTPTRALAVAAAFAAAVAVAGCGGDAYPNETPGALHVYVPSEMRGFDPTQAGEETTTIGVINYYDQLYEYAYLKRPYELSPCLAEGMPEVSSDERTYTIRLKKGIRYADDPCFVGGKGRELVASDVVFCLKRLMDWRVDPKGSWILEDRVVGLDEFRAATKTIPKDLHRAAYTSREGYPEVEGLRAADDHTLEIRLTRPYPQLVWVLAMPYASVYPPEAVARYGAEFMNHPVSTGPYLIAEYNPTQRLVLVRNPTYREDTFPSEHAEGDEARADRIGDVGKRLPLNDRVVVTVFKEQQPQWLYFMRGFLDRTAIPKDNFSSAVDDATQELRPGTAARGIRLDKDPRLEIIYDCFNMFDPVVGQTEKGRAIRRAISLAMDEDWANEHLYNFRVSRVDGPLIEEFAEYDRAFRNPWKKRPDETRAQVIERARAELRRAEIDPAALPAIEHDVVDTTTNRQHFAAAQRDLAEVGIRLKAHNVTWQEMQQRADKAQITMWGQAWGADYPDPQNFLQLFYGPNKAPGPNASNYLNPKFDELYDKAATMRAGDERTRLYREMQEIVVDDCVWVFKYRRLQYSLIQPWTTGYRYNDISPRTYKYCRIDDARRRADNERTNAPEPLPMVMFGGAVFLLLGSMVVVARRTKRGW